MRSRLSGVIAEALVRPDFFRALRVGLAAGPPLVLAVFGWLPLEPAFVVTGAFTIAMADVRGAYGLRIAFLGTMALLLLGATELGKIASVHPAASVAATALVALNMGVWRHLSPEYGPSLSIPAALLFFLALHAGPEGPHGLGALIGSAWGVALQMAFWPVRPQHPLRRTVAEAWIAASELFAALAPPDGEDGADARRARIAGREAGLRSALDQSARVLSATGAGRAAGVVRRLDALRIAGAVLAMRVTALDTAIESLAEEQGAVELSPGLRETHDSLAASARAVGLAVVSRQPAHLAEAEVRLGRTESLLGALRARLEGRAGPGSSQVLEVLRQLDAQLPRTRAALRGTLERADERGLFPLEVLDPNTWKLRPLASVLNTSRRPDPAISRFTLRVAVLMMLGVLAFKVFDVPHGYWLPLTVIVVLQPDFGATRRRAVERLAGTLAGSVIAGGLLALHPPLWTRAAITVCSVAAFGFLARKRYATAVLFVTVYVVLITPQIGAPLSAAIDRFWTTAAAGALSLGAALVFWPSWERDRFPGIFAGALRANAEFLRVLGERLAAGGAYAEPSVQAKRAAEAANAAALGSVERMFADPRGRRHGAENAAVLVNGSRRLTRALTLVMLHQTEGAPAITRPELTAFVECAGEALRTVGDAVERRGEAGGAEERAAWEERIAGSRRALVECSLAVPGGKPEIDQAGEHERWVFTQLARARVEISALLAVIARGEEDRGRG